jgi:hypothetical protein
MIEFRRIASKTVINGCTFASKAIWVTGFTFKVSRIWIETRVTDRNTLMISGKIERGLTFITDILIITIKTIVTTSLTGIIRVLFKVW